MEKAVDIKNLGNEFFQKGDFWEALKCYSEAIELCPLSDKQELPKFFQNRAAAYENLVITRFILKFSFLLFKKKIKKKQRMFEKVIEDCTSALQLDPNYSKALTRRAKALESIDKYQEAFEDYTALCILQKFSGSSMASADRMVKKIGEQMGKEIFKATITIFTCLKFIFAKLN